MLELYLGLGLSIVLVVAMGIFGCLATLDLIEYKNNEYKNNKKNKEVEWYYY